MRNFSFSFNTKFINIFTDVKASVLEGLDHCISSPITAYNNSLIDDDGIVYSGSKTEKKMVPWHDLKLDRLSEREKVQNYIHWIYLMPLPVNENLNS